MRRKKIFIAVTYLSDIGGICSAAINLLNEIHSNYDITLCVTSNYISPNIRLPEDIKIIKGADILGDLIIDRSFLKGQSLLRKCRRNAMRIINQVILKDHGIEYALKRIKSNENYDTAIAFSDLYYNNLENKSYDYYVVLNNIKADRKIAWIHNNPIKLGWTKDLADKRLRNFNYIVNVSTDCKNIFDTIAPVFKEKSKVVYNLYNIEKIRNAALAFKPYESTDDKIIFVTVARMEESQKKISRILKAVKRLKDEGYVNFRWHIVGAGGMLNNYINITLQNQTYDMIHFEGLQPNPFPYVKNADAFVLSSEYEGLGMTIIEAQILGTPTFITRFGASSEVVDDEKNGEICENSAEGVYRMIKGILDNPGKLDYYRDYIKHHPVSNKLGLSQFDSIV